MIKYIFFALICSLANLACAFGEIEKGVPINQDNEGTLWDTSVPYAIARQGLRSISDNEFIVSFKDLDSHVLGLSNSGRVIDVKREGRILIGNWSLSRWPTETTDKEVASIYDMEGASEGDVWHLYAHERVLNTNSLGCLANTPLRYGALENNGKDSLVIYMGKNDQQLDWILFSPQSAAIEFSARLALQDSVEAPPGSKVQYLSDALGRIGGVGRRAYAKIYFDDFDGDEELDILVWRKRYESRLQEDPIKGFELKKEVVRHYKFIEGAYQKQDTEEATIKTWLTTKQLTWSKGYPSKSECPGQTDQLIPEMHDPLLNDPDVLQ